VYKVDLIFRSDSKTRSVTVSSDWQAHLIVMALLLVCLAQAVVIRSMRKRNDRQAKMISDYTKRRDEWEQEARLRAKRIDNMRAGIDSVIIRLGEIQKL
jgi:hypothetical protein